MKKLTGDDSRATVGKPSIRRETEHRGIGRNQTSRISMAETQQIRAKKELGTQNLGVHGADKRASAMVGYNLTPPNLQQRMATTKFPAQGSARPAVVDHNLPRRNPSGYFRAPSPFVDTPDSDIRNEPVNPVSVQKVPDLAKEDGAGRITGQKHLVPPNSLGLPQIVLHLFQSAWEYMRWLMNFFHQLVKPDATKVNCHTMATDNTKKATLEAAAAKPKAIGKDHVEELPSEPVVNCTQTAIGVHFQFTGYDEAIYSFYRLREVKIGIPDDMFCHKQSADGTEWRGTINWMIRMHAKRQLNAGSLHLSVQVFSRYMAKQKCSPLDLNYKLAGAASLLIAIKYEETCRARVSIFTEFAPWDVITKEKMILKKLNWNVSFPTTLQFATLFLKIHPSRKVEKLVLKLLHLSLVDRHLVSVPPSQIAASAVLVARGILELNPSWTPSLQQCTQYSESELWACSTHHVQNAKTAGYVRT